MFVLTLKFLCVSMVVSNELHRVTSFSNSTGMYATKTFTDDFPDSSDTEISKASDAAIKDNEITPTKNPEINKRQSDTEVSNPDESDDEDSNPDDDFVDGQTVESLFTAKDDCRIMYSLSVELKQLTPDECMDECLEADSCNSVAFKPSSDPADTTCYLNTESRYDVGPFFRCSVEESAGWIHYEKIPDYFLIFNKDTGKVLKPLANHQYDGNIDVALTMDNVDEAFWFWSGESIRSKRSPFFMLSVTKNSNLVTFETAGNPGAKQRWSISGDDDKLSPIIAGEDQHLGLSRTAGQQTVITGSLEDLVSEHWSLSLERSYFVLTHRRTGKVVQANNNDGTVVLTNYKGDDNQLWFWEDEALRSKQFPDKMIEMDGIRRGDQDLHGYTNVRLASYDRHSVRQKWVAGDDDSIQTLHEDRPASLCAGTSNNDIKPIVNCRDGELEEWSFGSLRVNFIIVEKTSGKVLTASTAQNVEMQTFAANAAQQWFWDQDVIRSKKYPTKSLTIDQDNTVRLLDFDGSNERQTWKYHEDCLVSKSNNLKMKTSGETVQVDGESQQEWSITISHKYFTIWDKYSGQVLDVSQGPGRGRDVITWRYHGQDHQRWFWDGRNIRSKKYPTKVLEIVEGTDSWLNVQVGEYNGRASQKWQHNGLFFVSDRQRRNLNVKEYVPAKSDMKRVGACRDCTDVVRKSFSYSSQKPVYFALHYPGGNKFLSFFGENKWVDVQASAGNEWFWEGQNIRSKEDPRFILTLQKQESINWYRLTTERYHDPPRDDRRQIFTFNEEHFIHGYLDGFQFEYRQGNMGGRSIPGRQTGNNMIKMVMVENPTPEEEEEEEEEEESCVNETEQKIYRVVEWIPFISTLWDLFSSIGYGIAGCDSVAQERAISMSIGLVTDIASAVTFGAAAPAVTVLKTGAKVGIKLGLKAGLKATVTVAKSSLKKAFTKVVKLGLKQGAKKFVAKTGKFIAKETIIDPAMFLKNIGKISKQVLTRPKKTFRQLWRASKQGINDLKTLKRKIRRKLLREGKDVCGLKKHSLSNLHKNMTMVNQRSSLTKRGKCKIELPSKPELASAKTDFESLGVKDYIDTHLSAAQGKYGKLLNEKDFTDWKNNLKRVPTKSELEELQVYAIFDYTKHPNINEYTTGLVQDVKAVKKIVEKKSKDDLTSAVNQGILMQDYLKNHPTAVKAAGKEEFTEQVVYRYEPKDWKDTWTPKKGETEITTTTFTSTTKWDDPATAFGEDFTFKRRQRQLVIKLKKSGTDLDRISYYQRQKEVLIPYGTKFKHTKTEVVDKVYDKVKNKKTKVTQIFLEEV